MNTITKLKYPQHIPGEYQIRCADNPGCGETIQTQVEHVKGTSLENSHFPYLLDTKGNMTRITQAIFNLGRKLDNDLSIPDARISRKHAQIRVTPDEYVVFDLDSKGGTFVNDVRISHHKLQHGDVISLAGYLLVFGVDPPQNPDVMSDSVESSDTQILGSDSDLPLEFIG